MTALLPLVTGVLAGFFLALAVSWLPKSIEQEEAEWIAAVTEKDVPTERISFLDHCRENSWFSRDSVVLAVLCALLSLGVAIRYGADLSNHEKLFGSAMPLKVWSLMIFGWGMLALAMIDFKTRFLPDALTQPLLWLGLLFQLSQQTATVGIESAVLGATLGYILLWLSAQVFLLVRRQEGLGRGDMKLMAVVGAWLGPLAVPMVLFIGACLGLIWQLIAITRGKAKTQDAFAFGPWLIVGALIYMF